MPLAPVSGGGSDSAAGTNSGGFEAFFRAIAGQESGGNYGAINSRTGASGKYQIMPANIGPWSRKYLGYTITVSQFRKNPQLQEDLARAVLLDYYRKWGPRGAASAWYSGTPNKQNVYRRFRSNEPSVGEYVDSILRRMGEVPRGTTRTSTDAPDVGYTQLGVSTHTPAKPKVTNITPQVSPAKDAYQVPDPFANLSSGDPFKAAGNGDPFAPTGNGYAGTPAKQVGVPTSAIDESVASGPKPGESQSAFRDRVITEAMKYMGVPYVWGGTSPKGFDCSGIIKYVYGKFGFNLPRISAQQARSGRRTNINNLRAGDLVAWDNSSRNNGADHIAIYAGNGYIIEAPRTGLDVRRRKLGKNEGAWGVSLDLPGD